MVGQPKPEVSLLDSAFSKRKKRSRNDSLLQRIEQFVDWQKLEVIYRPMYKDSRRGRPSIPIQFFLKCLMLQYLYLNISRGRRCLIKRVYSPLSCLFSVQSGSLPQPRTSTTARTTALRSASGGTTGSLCPRTMKRAAGTTR